MVKGVMDATSTSSDFYTLFDNLVATNPQLERQFVEVRNETNLFLCKVLRFYTTRDLCLVKELNTNDEYMCHMTHEMLSYEVSLNCMCDGSVKQDLKYGTYIEPYNDIYGVVANVRFRDNVDEKCLLQCLNYQSDKSLFSNVRNGEIRLVVGESTLSLTNNRINLMTPTLIVNGLPYNEPKLNNYYDKSEISSSLSLIQADFENSLNELENRINSIEVGEINLEQYMKKQDYIDDLENQTDTSHFLQALDNTIVSITGRGDDF